MKLGVLYIVLGSIAILASGYLIALEYLTPEKVMESPIKFRLLWGIPAAVYCVLKGRARIIMSKINL